MAKKKSKTDWRKLPRKPASQKRRHQLGLRVTDAELEELRSLASDADMTLADYVISRALHKRRR